MLESIAEHRGLWSATFDILTQSGQDEATREQLAASLDEARRGLARLFEGIAESDTSGGRAIGSLYQALLTGLAAQVLIDPDHAPSGKDLAAALRRITS
ncbi:TetR family transcriptional regulator C-terminal domain-containing protein [Nocardia sp. NPDC050412]|uniref:TetR family transcriptional regulator C-terminal domain-containing protein n=1 Tax=unclassified Nocardia TaxID=2637762 RepID=UPI0037ADB57D